MLKTSYDYGRHLYEDGAVYLCSSPKELPKMLVKVAHIPKSQIDKMRASIWDKKNYTRKRLRETLESFR